MEREVVRMVKAKRQKQKSDQKTVGDEGVMVKGLPSQNRRPQPLKEKGGHN